MQTDAPKKEHLDPAKTIIARAGGVDEVAKITEKHVSRVYRWMYSKQRGGTGGYIPHEDARKILDHAQRTGLSIEAGDFLDPAPNKEQAG